MKMNMMKRICSSGLAWLWVAVVIIVLDRWAKEWCVQHLTFHEPTYVLPVFNLTLYYNTGAAFSFLQTASGWQNWFFGSLAFVVSVFIVCWLAKLPSRQYWLGIALCLILGGALGNAWDRITYHYVIDFLSFHYGSWYFAIFNTADAAISVGAAMVFLSWCFQKNNKG